MIPNNRARPGLLFLCMANSARSQMAEGYARALAPAGIEVWSAGSRPGRVHPMAVQVMLEAGIDIRDQRSKGLDEVPHDRVGTVVTLCAEEVCPLFPGEVRRLHWPLADPAAVEGSEAERLAAFRNLRDQIGRRVAGMWIRRRPSQRSRLHAEG